MVIFVVESTGCPLCVAGRKRICCATRARLFVQSMSEAVDHALHPNPATGQKRDAAQDDVALNLQLFGFAGVLEQAVLRALRCWCPGQLLLPF